MCKKIIYILIEKCILPALRELKQETAAMWENTDINVSYPHCGN